MESPKPLERSEHLGVSEASMELVEHHETPWSAAVRLRVLEVPWRTRITVDGECKLGASRNALEC